MRKIGSFILTAVMLLVLMGCDSAGSTNIGMTEPTHTNHGPVLVHVTEISRDEQGLRLEVEWKNNSNIEALFGSAYRIQRKEGNAWVDCTGDREPIFDAIAYILPPGGSRKEVYYPEFFFDLSKPGTYRFISKCTLEEVDTMEVWAEFTLDKTEKDAQADRMWQNPPDLKLTCGEIITEIGYAGCSWFCMQNNGMMAATMADHADPMMMQNSIQSISADLSHFRISFDAAPDQWSAECWPAEDWAEGTADSHSVQLAEDGFLARPGKWVYVIRGAWEDKGEGWYGTAEYYFVIETETGNVNGNAR